MADHEKKSFNRRALYVALGILVIFGGGSAAAAYLAVSQRTVYIDQSSIEAPVVDLSSTQGGVLRALDVQAGQVVTPGTVVAQVGVELIKATAGGLVIATEGDVGDQVAPGATVVEMIDPNSLRVVGELDENKGLDLIKVGDPVTFTVDAFGGQQFTGVVDEISPTANASGIVFNISNQRQTQQFDVKARFDVAAYPQLKNGMSARMWVYVQ
jgi:multidrug resistance efflux pump